MFRVLLITYLELFTFMHWFYVCLKGSSSLICFVFNLWARKLLSFVDWFYVLLKASFLSCFVFLLWAWELFTFMHWFNVCLKTGISSFVWGNLRLTQNLYRIMGRFDKSCLCTCKTRAWYSYSRREELVPEPQLHRILYYHRLISILFNMTTMNCIGTFWNTTS